MQSPSVPQEQPGWVYNMELEENNKENVGNKNELSGTAAEAKILKEGLESLHMDMSPLLNGPSSGKKDTKRPPPLQDKDRRESVPWFASMRKDLTTTASPASPSPASRPSILEFMELEEAIDHGDVPTPCHMLAPGGRIQPRFGGNLEGPLTAKANEGVDENKGPQEGQNAAEEAPVKAPRGSVGGAQSKQGKSKRESVLWFENLRSTADKRMQLDDINLDELVSLPPLSPFSPSFPPSLLLSFSLSIPFSC
eukprot:354539-Rhodomonas_salina.2